MKVDYDFFTIISGSNNILISAPHTYCHIRNKKKKKMEIGLLDIIDILSKKTNAHFIYTNKDINYDPNYDKDNAYQEKMKEYIKKNNIEYVLDLHGMSSVYKRNVEIGTNYLKNINYDSKLLDKIVSIFSKNSISSVYADKRFLSSGNTICNVMNSTLGVFALQMEINKTLRLRRNKKFIGVVNSLTDIILYLERVQKFGSIDYGTKYDKVLDIKPAYGYKVDLGKVPYDHVGLEIEVSVHYNRSSFSFIKKMLVNIKKIVGNNGYFVKDGTILGDYSFEIVLNPMSISDIHKIYSDIRSVVDFSSGIIDISKKSNCGIHLNFNKLDIKNIEDAHKKVTLFVRDYPQFFETNMYKRFKFCWDFNKYEEYQKNISNKYLWINYLKSKVVEIRNIKADILPDDLSFILSKFISFFYDDEVYLEQGLDMFQVYDSLFESDNGKDLINSLNNSGLAILKMDGSKCNFIPVSEEVATLLRDKDSNIDDKLSI